MYDKEHVHFIMYPMFHEVAGSWYQLYDFEKCEYETLSKCNNVYDYCIFFESFYRLKMYNRGLRRTYALPGLKVIGIMNDALSNYEKIVKSTLTIQKYFRGHFERRIKIPYMMKYLMHPDSVYIKWKVAQIFT